ncbi:MAG: hypothetical protein HYZ49_10200 [Chloroflexi bacterium]|nr:hypothetical protein [Chloroflexota bacterium]
MLRWLIRNIPTFILSLALAFTIWIVALNEEDPFEEKVFPEPLAVTVTNLPENMVLVGNPLPTIDVSIRAPQSVWAALTPDQLSVTLDLGEAQSGTFVLPLNAVIIDERNARITALTPAQVQVSIENVVNRSVPVRLEVSGQPATGYQADEGVAAPAQGSISGPASLADSVSELVARVDLDNTKESIAGVAPLAPQNASGQVVSGVTVNPATATVSVPIKQLGGFRDVAVKAVVVGQVSSGYRLTNYVVSPLVVTVFSSDPALVANMPGFVETEPLDISDANDDKEARLSLRLPEGVSLVSPQTTVLVQASIDPIVTSTTIERELEIQGLGQGLSAAVPPTTVVVILTGPVSTLDALTPEEVHVVVNLLNLPPGVHQVSPEVVDLPERVTAKTISPATIEVLITSPGTPTQTPTHAPIPTNTRPPTLAPTRTPAPTLTPTETATATPS